MSEVITDIIDASPSHLLHQLNCLWPTVPNGWSSTQLWRPFWLLGSQRRR